MHRVELVRRIPEVPPTRAAAPAAELDAAVALLRAPDRPLLLTGSGIVWADVMVNVCVDPNA